MTAISLNNAKDDLESIVSRVLANAEPVVLNTPNGESVVVMPLDDFTSWQETAYLLKNPANAARLRKSFDEYQRGQFSEHELDER